MKYKKNIPRSDFRYKNICKNFIINTRCIVIEDALAGVQAAKSAKMRCIAVTTTLSEDTLKEAEPSIIRKDIGNISLQDIIGGGSSYSNTKMQDSQSMKNPAVSEGISFQEAYSTNDMVFSVGGLQGSRRQISRYGSLGIALSCFYFTISNLKFGDHDETGSEVLLQHPLGVLCGKDGHIYVADSYNHKIKNLDLATKKVSTLAGTGKAGFKDGAASSAQLSEPAGIVEADTGRLFIADTNNSQIRYLDLNKQDVQLLTLELKGVQPPASKSRSQRRLRRRTSADTETVVVDGSISNEGNLNLTISVPEGYHFSKEARSKFSVEIEPENAAVVDFLDGNLSPDGTAILHFKRSSPFASVGRVSCKVYYCKEDEVCLYQHLVFEVPFKEVSLENTVQDIKLPFVVKPRSSEGTLQLPVLNDTNMRN